MFCKEIPTNYETEDSGPCTIVVQKKFHALVSTFLLDLGYYTFDHDWVPQYVR